MFVSPVYMVYVKDTLLFYSPAIRATLAIFASHPPTASLCVSSECSYGFASLFRFNITMFSFLFRNLIHVCAYIYYIFLNS